MEEKALIQLCKKRDRQAQEMLYKQFSGKMYAVCLMYAHDRDEAQDILQDAFIKVFKNIKKLELTGSLEGWVRRIVVNTALDYARKRSKSKVSEWDERLINVSEEDLATDETESVANVINQLLEKIPLKAKMIFNLYVVEGYSHQEIAKELGISIGTSKSQYFRAKELVRLAYAKVKK